MTAAELGKKLKEARLAKKMTQAQVVGDFITRNMLSQIESGTATPSIKTLQYLARVLELPMEQLIADEDPPVADAPYRMLLQAKDAIRRGDFTAVPTDETTFPAEVADELYALAARALLERARAEQGDGTPNDVLQLVRRAIAYADQGLYRNETLRSEAVLFLHEQAQRLGAYYQSLVAPGTPPELWK